MVGGRECPAAEQADLREEAGDAVQRADSLTSGVKELPVQLAEAQAAIAARERLARERQDIKQRAGQELRRAAGHAARTRGGARP